MGKYDKLIFKILRGSSDANISFSDLCELLKRLGFEERIRGSHHVFRKEGIEEKINLQSDAAKAKPYQVRQVRSILVKYRLSGEAK
jgi:predicted RNA binding protein YcfA (HicA-like mRNA interferase family)